MNTYYHSIKNLQNEGKEQCKRCGTTGVIVRELYLKEVCNKCKGEGTIDWISNITGTPSQKSPDELIVRELHIENVHHLIREIKSIFYQHGLTTIVEVKALRDNHNPHPLTISVDEYILKRKPYSDLESPPFKKIISV